MTKCSNWKNVIPNLDPCDVVTAFEEKLKRFNANSYNGSDGNEHEDPLEKCACVKRASTGKIGVYNSEGKVIVPEEYDFCDVYIMNSPESYFSAIFVQKYDFATDIICGFFDAEGKSVIPVDYPEIRVYPNNKIIVKGKNNLYGMYTHKGEKIVDCIFESLNPNDEIIRFEDKFRKQKVEDDYYFGGGDYTDILETYTAIRRERTGKIAVYNANGEEVLPEIYDDCDVLIGNTPEFYISGLLVRKDTKTGLYNAYGVCIVPEMYKRIHAVDNMLIVSDENDLYGMYSPDGKKITDCIYDRIDYDGSLDEGGGRAIVVKKGLYGVISENGEEIVPVIYGYVDEKSYGYDGYKVIDPKNHELFGWYSKDGKVKIPCEYSKIKIKNNEIRVQTPDGKKGVYSIGGKEILSVEYRKIKQIGSYKVTYDKETDTLKVFNSEGNILYSTK